MNDDTQQLAIYVLRWLDRNDLSMTNLREIMDSIGNYNRTLGMLETDRRREFQHGDNMNEMKHATEINDILWKILSVSNRMLEDGLHGYDTDVMRAMECLDNIKKSLVPDFHEQHKEMIE